MDLNSSSDKESRRIWTIMTYKNVKGYFSWG